MAEFSDWSLLDAELRASSAYADALHDADGLNDDEHRQIAAALQEIDTARRAGQLTVPSDGADVFDTVDQQLADRIGVLTGKLQAGRSRPERRLTAIRLWLIEQIEAITESTAALQRVLLNQSEGSVGALMPGYVHYRPAQVLAAGHWLLAYFWMLARDQERLTDCVGRLSQSPLGSGLLAGTPYRIDRTALAQAAGFSEPTPNSLDAITDWDFALEFMHAATLIGIHLSRLAEELLWFSSPALGFVSFDATAINALVRARGSCSALASGFMAGVITLKALAPGYNQDASDICRALYTAVGTLADLLPGMSGIVESLTLHADRMWDALDESILLSDLVDYLAARGVGYVEAQQAVARVAERAEEASVPLSEIALSDFQAESSAFDADVYATLDFSHSVAQRAALGGTAPAAIRAQIRQANTWLVDAGLE